MGFGVATRVIKCPKRTHFLKLKALIKCHDNIRLLSWVESGIPPPPPYTHTHTHTHTFERIRGRMRVPIFSGNGGILGLIVSKKIMRFNEKARNRGVFFKRFCNQFSNRGYIPFPRWGGGGHVIRNDHRHGCTGPLSVRGARLRSVARLFSPLLTEKQAILPRIWLFENL